uniref:ABC transporter n=1 Tax=Cyberlindnera americana TaxID=36016 RepID=A0A5P8N9M2_9ASCO|nr:ABC transporter [Cyberlindnera americana]
MGLFSKEKTTVSEKSTDSQDIENQKNSSLTSTTEEISSLSESEYNKLQSKIYTRKGNPIIKLLTQTYEPRPITQNEEIYPYLTANWFSLLTFQWASDMINRGHLRRVEEEDLYKLGGDLAVGDMTTRFEANLLRRIEEHRGKHPEDAQWSKWVLVLALNDTFKKRFWYVSGIGKVIADVSQVTTPLLVRKLVQYVQKKSEIDTGVGHAIGFAVGISLMQMVSALSIANYFHGSMVVGAQVKATLMNVIYSKSFKLSTKARFEFPNGKINSLVMTDLNRIDIAVATFHFLWAFPISFGIATAVLCVNLGASGLIGIGIVLTFLCSLVIVNRKLKEWRLRSGVFIDKRVRAINEIISTLKMIKFYCWEKPYYKQIEEYRAEEKKSILKMQLLKAAMNTGVSSVTIMAAMVTFLVMIHVSSNFSAASIFSSITLFNVLRMPLNLIPMASSFAIDALIALSRVSDYLQADEAEDTVERHDLEDSTNAIEVVNATFQWDVEEDESTKMMKETIKAVTTNATEAEEETGEDLSFPGLLNINLSIARGELVILTGSIGTGKTSLLNAIEGSMRKESGDSKIYGSLTFCSYPWVQNATIRDNITFGMPYDPAKYQTVVKACALDVDFKNLPGADMTEVGERGITLSGGQKARINLARAVYADRDIILLDDVLSAVDARVGKHIMDECICGLLANKTRLLATHQLSLIGAANRIIILDGSGSLDVGTQEELLLRSSEFKNLMEYSKEAQEEEEETDKLLIEEEQEIISKQLTQLSRVETTKKEEEDEVVAEGSNQEARSSDAIGFGLYFRYMALGAGKLGYGIIPIFMVVFLLNGFLQVFYSVWLSFWLSGKFNLSQGTNEGIFIMLVFAAAISYAVLFGLMAYVNNNAGLRLFNLSSSRLLKTPMWFMDITPLGRILNRFTKDVDTLDTDMIEQLRLFVTSINTVGATVILCSCYIPWFLIAIPFAGYGYYLIFAYYKQSALDIKRLEANGRSSVFALFNESLSGMKVIKSYASADRFKVQYEHLVDKMNTAYFFTFASQRWLSVRLDVISSMLTLLLSILCVCGVFSVNSASAGLMVSYMVQMCATMSILLRSFTQVENDFNSVERLFEYAYDLPQEPGFDMDEKPEESWPQTGSIDFDDVSLSYREGLPLVLKNVSFSVRGGEKIGVCGRTGAGKSTIMNALFRVSPLSSGKIEVDGLDIGTIGLQDLRTKLSIIPQDPVLFHGTIRKNLDPFGTATDMELWDALRRSWLVEEGASGVGQYVGGETNIKTLHKFHLDQLVEDDGANFSLGERQLLALARALVRNSKVLILDEATSSVDYETDAKIQSTIVNEFGNCTILCIAHRLKTILNYDKILVLDKGEVREYDSPINLFNMGGIFTEMCQRSDITASDFE